jgi:hypothetical protein
MVLALQIKIIADNGVTPGAVLPSIKGGAQRLAEPVDSATSMGTDYTLVMVFLCKM